MRHGAGASRTAMAAAPAGLDSVLATTETANGTLVLRYQVLFMAVSPDQLIANAAALVASFDP